MARSIDFRFFPANERTPRDSGAQNRQRTISGQELEKVQEIVAANTAFALDLYGQLQKHEGNLFYSPLSISTALGMTHWGARGDTAKQMAEVLYLPKEDEQLPEAIQVLLGRLENMGAAGSGYELAVANALWGQTGFPFLQPYLGFQKEHYGAGLQLVDFRGATEEVTHFGEVPVLDGATPASTRSGVVSLAFQNDV